ncbi:hypothetical protein [Aeromonas simiae]|nr:hypothetical protein [Aeromonas simiae]MDO2950103.1 hypothetical protein [Aeromonas simiae]MDO2953783.1 hypothetical protein [Aeromonas simiae]MDO2957476.1 hypothetical protein [Aeromonas simiae]
MDKLDHEIDTMRHELELYSLKQAEEKWQARVDELARQRAEQEKQGSRER